MHISTFYLTLVAGLVAAVSIGAPSKPDHEKKCIHPRVRKAWHTLANEEKLEYIQAVQCLYQLPPQGNSYFAGITNRHEDFSSVHKNQSSIPDPNNITNNFGFTGPGIHLNGIFLPFHRYFVWAFENALIEECQYTGAQPYWDWTRDNSEFGRRFADSVVFDATYGFGGNGANGLVDDTTIGIESAFPVGSCVENGPFTNLVHKLSWGYNLNVRRLVEPMSVKTDIFEPSTIYIDGDRRFRMWREQSCHVRVSWHPRQNEIRPRCTIRNFDETWSENCAGWSNAIKPALKQTNYAEFVRVTDQPDSSCGIYGYHGAIHRAVGGEMDNFYSSPADPLFMLHHAQIDHVWWTWQNLQPSHKWSIGGPVYPNITGGTVDLDYLIDLAPFVGPGVQVSQLLDTVNKNGHGVLCYKYEQEARWKHPFDESYTEDLNY